MLSGGWRNSAQRAHSTRAKKRKYQIYEIFRNFLKWGSNPQPAGLHACATTGSDWLLFISRNCYFNCKYLIFNKIIFNDIWVWVELFLPPVDFSISWDIANFIAELNATLYLVMRARIGISNFLEYTYHCTTTMSNINPNIKQ